MNTAANTTVATAANALARATRPFSRRGLAAHKWLLMRRATQFAILALFLAGPLAGVWIVKGNLSSSLVLEVLPLTDPYLLLQSLAAGHSPYTTALLGAAIVLGFYFLTGGRVFCAWVCPVNIVTDAAAWLRTRLGIAAGRSPAPATRYWLLAGTLIGSFATGTILWEWVNPVSMLHRGLIFGAGLAWFIVAGIFLFDMLVAARGWCGHLCPVGAFYSLLGHVALPRVSAPRRAACDNCMDCYRVCPEPQVLRPALKGAAGSTPLILSPNCTNCGRCIDVCNKDVFRFTTRFDHRSECS